MRLASKIVGFKLVRASINTGRKCRQFICLYGRDACIANY